MTTGANARDLLASTLAEPFRCHRLSATLSRDMCGTIWSAGQVGCKHCDIGAAHARGQLHAMAPTVEAVVPAVDLTRKLPRRRCMGCQGPLPKGRTHVCGPACAVRSSKSMEAAARTPWARA